MAGDSGPESQTETRLRMTQTCADDRLGEVGGGAWWGGGVHCKVACVRVWSSAQVKVTQGV